jgi:CRISPR-associated protein Cas1
MLKRTLYFGNPAYLKTSNEQMIVSFPKEVDGLEEKSIPIEDIGIIILDHQQITVTQALMSRLLENNTALITCDSTHHPVGMMLNLDGNTLQSQKFRAQVVASQPLKKQLWQQTITSKITNQASVLKTYNREHKYLMNLTEKVKSGDSENHEAQAAAYYWSRLFDESLDFKRARDGEPPNNLLNYGYAILRAIVARALVGSGLMPTLGIFHRNQYNAYCLADDIMEPYRPFVDKIVMDIVVSEKAYYFLTTEIKKILLSIPTITVEIDNKKSPLMNAVTKTTSSLAGCFEGKQRKILYPVLQ